MKSFLLGILLFSCFISLGQSASNERTVPVYEADPILAGENIRFIPVNFNADQLLSEIPTELKSLTIERIDLVYTTYKENPSFDQAKLNEGRINRIKSAWPETKSPLINWNLIGQTQATDNSSARSLFHGFVVYYREKPTAESIESELEQIDAYLENGAFPAEVKTVPSKHSESIAGGDSLSGPIEETSEVPVNDAVAKVEMIASPPRASKADVKEARKLGGIPVKPAKGEHARISMLRNDNFQNECYSSESGIFKGNNTDFLVFNDSMMSCERMTPWASYSSDATEEGKVTNHYYVYYSLNEECDTAYTIDFSNPFSWDNKEFNAVQATFERHPEWENTHIIMDVTGSMSPYIAKTMAWIKATQDSSQVQAFTFFNDGNATPDRKKRVGEVGGIYSVENKAYDPVYNQMKNTMRKGGGGDCPENNIEATISGMKSFPDCDEIIMVADNWATPRDLSLLGKIKVPIHIIVCGGQNGINIDFIQAAYETGGSIHTIEDDLDLRSIKPGKQFRVGRNYFTLSGGKIVRAEHK